MDIVLRFEVDAEARERAAEGRKHAVGRKRVVPAGAAEEAAYVPAFRLREADADALAENTVHRLLVEPLRRVEEGMALGRQALEVVEEPVAVELEVRGRPELRHRALGGVDGVDVDRVEVLL